MDKQRYLRKGIEYGLTSKERINKYADMQFNRRLFHTKAKTAMSSGEWDAREVPLLPRGATAPAASTESGRRPGEQWDRSQWSDMLDRKSGAIP